jgi:hypothetical protein
MTTALTGASNPLAALKPVVVVASDNYAVRVVLGVDAVPRDKRDAAIAYLNELIGGTGLDSSFKLEATGIGALYSLYGNTGSTYTKSDEFRAIVDEGIQPEFSRVGTLTVEIARATTRQMVGVQCTLTATDRGSSQAIPKLEDKPGDVYGLNHRGTKVTFSLKEVSHKDDDELIAAAMRVAKAFGVYVEHPPTEVGDKDPDARLYPEFNYVERAGA